ncbi:spermidine/putrescine ABC transporter ATP-binding protein [Corynebacterium sp. HMSC058E07]|uniref:ABC transporter ATP-binding protein n=1 Tax=Corynebacterium TaxID=1716 RepID=UPI000552A884|nr:MULTISPECIES: ABC transporter ATP-binding protein [Corynebacterium]MDK8869098.1 ABC transporter ATP-binding protein [Corynebacterium macclintockiae]OFM59589.1 spermidine/putrescine ABC transporter ATP-binding protein [Corynebacterium sp. HMSC058E07]
MTKKPESPLASTSPVLELRDVVKTFGDRRAVDGLSFDLAAGQVLALIGPNGAGKTTTVEMCEGFLRPTEGTIRVFGKDPAVASDEVRSRIGVMLQGGGAYPGIRVGEMMRLVASYSKNPLDPDWLLKTVGLDGHEKTPYRRLSGGQQQRLSLACALVGRPELVFLDEPTAGLDAQSRLAVWDLVASLKRDGVAVVLTTHLMDEAEALADQVVIIDSGRIVASGTTEEMTSRRSPHSRAAWLSVQVDMDAPLPDVATAIAQHTAAQVNVEELRPRHFKVEADELNPALIAAVTAAFADLNVMIRQLEANRQSLEDVFLSITGKDIRS